MFNLILFGPPGAGKGTQSANVINKYGFEHVSTGDILRNEIENKTPVGIKAQSFMDNGELVPDDVLLSILHKVYTRHADKKGIVWDGFPRTLIQARGFDKLLESEGASLNLVIALNVEQDELIRRVWKRSLNQHRSDDREDIILQRFKIYKERTMPLIEYYKEQGKFECVSGMDDIDVVHNKICTKIDHYMNTH